MSNMKDKINPPYYIGTKIQVSDFIHEFKLDYFQGNIVKYVVRHKSKGGIEDLESKMVFGETYRMYEEIKSAIIHHEGK